MIKLSDYVVKFIEGLGVRHVFMLPGGGAMHLNDSLGRSKKLYYICSLHEQAAAIAADAYSQYTNNIGVAMVTTGPGGTNALTGVAASWLDSIPVIIISGQVKRADIVGTRKVRQMGFQEIDIVSLARPITKYAVTITKPEEIRWHLEKAVYHARKGRPGPVWIDIPLDVQASMLDEKKLRGFVPERKKAEDALLKRKIARAVGLLNRAKRPVILAGNGIRLAGALKAFRDLLAILKVPVLTTWKAADYLPETHPLYIGRPGAVGQRGANFAQQNADLLISIGARLDFGQTAYNHGLFARGARKIIVDIDAAEIAKLDMNIDVPIQADAGLVIREMIGQCRNGFGKEKFTLWLSQCKA
ncbi:MAG TPA: thiamine pyrophosphate-binding protein, partial [Dissulfurispiraceae bacterium]